MRNGRAIGSPPALIAEWTMPLIRTSEVGNWLKQATATLADRNQPLLAGAAPVTVLHELPDGKKLPVAIFRSHWGIHAMDMNTGKRLWETPSSWSMDRMVRDIKKVGAINRWVAAQPNALFENSTVGTLSADDALVFMIEDIEVPPGQAVPAAVRQPKPGPADLRL